MGTLKELGVSAIRMSHYSHQDYIHDLCGKMSLLVQDEVYEEWEEAKNKWIEGWDEATLAKERYPMDF